MRVLIRCDASLAIGSGHVMRCRNLARALKQRGAEVLFVCREKPGDLIDLLAEEFSVMRLPSLSDHELSLDSLQGRDLYAAWLGCSQLEDVDDCLRLIDSAEIESIDWLVVDHYGLDQRWERLICEGLRRSNRGESRLLVFDDLADRPHQADVLVDPNRLHATASDTYQPQMPIGCRMLFGPA